MILIYSNFTNTKSLCECPIIGHISKATQIHTKNASMSTSINTREDFNEKGGALMMGKCELLPN